MAGGRRGGGRRATQECEGTGGTGQVGKAAGSWARTSGGPGRAWVETGIQNS